jgi:hypothetical protein
MSADSVDKHTEYIRMGTFVACNFHRSPYERDQSMEYVTHKGDMWNAHNTSVGGPHNKSQIENLRASYYNNIKTELMYRFRNWI